MSTTFLPPRTHPVLDALRGLDTDLAELVDAPLWTLAEDELLAARVAMESMAHRFTALRWATTREIDTRGAAVSAGATSTRDWLAAVARQHPAESTREVALAGEVTDPGLPATAAGLAAGDLSPAAAAVIADTDRRLAKYADRADRGQAEALLAGLAGTLNPKQLATAALHLRNRLDPDQGDRLADDEAEQTERRAFRLRPNPDGSAVPGGYLDKESAATLRAALDAAAKPRPAGSDTDAGADGSPGTESTDGPDRSAGPDGSAGDGAGEGAPGRDRRSPAQRNADALLELIRRAMRTEAPRQAGQPVQVTVTVNYHDLVRRLADAPRDGDPHPYPPGGLFGAAGVLADTGLPLSVAAVRRLACDAQIIPVVLGTDGEPLDVGRGTRLISTPLRRALEIRDGGCCFPGCDRPPKWTQGHHITHWADGGDTALHNLVLLCHRHHRAVHHDGWDVRIDTDALPTFQPPAWIDPQRPPRRNHRLRPLRPRPAAQPDVPPDPDSRPPPDNVSPLHRRT